MNKKRHIFNIIILCICVLGIIAVFWFFGGYISHTIDTLLSSESATVKITRTQTSTPETEETKTTSSLVENQNSILFATSSLPEPISSTEKKELVSISILNSTGIPGLAAQLSSLLTKNGFHVSSTGNTTPKESITRIQVRRSALSSFPKSIEELKSFVTSKYSRATQSELTESGVFDVIIIIGSQ